MTYTFGIDEKDYIAGYNEDGSFYRTMFTVIATSDYGEVYAYHLNFKTAKKAEDVRASFERRATTDWTPKNDYWQFQRYVYGSKAYCDNYKEAESSLMDDEEYRFHYGI